jgi:hypothetical protein
MASSATNISESGDLAHSGTTVLDDFSETYRESESHAKYFIFLPSARDLKCAIIKNSLPLSRTLDVNDRN